MKKQEKDKQRGVFKKISERVRKKIRIIILNNDTYEENSSFVLSFLQIAVYSLFTLIFLIFLSFTIISFTSLKHLIPGYPSIITLEEIKKKDNENIDKLLSIEKKLEEEKLYYQNLKIILEGNIVKEDINSSSISSTNDSNKSADFNISEQDSLLRLKIDEREKYDISLLTSSNKWNEKLNGVLFFSPLKGEITNHFNLKEGHYGVDVIASKNEAVKAVLSGTVVYNDWTPENGHVIQVQHQQNLISVYKHNSYLLKKTGDIIKAGDPVAIVGNSGELSTGPHLHFELWHNGVALDPEKFIVFN